MEETKDISETFVWTVRSYECAADGKITVANLCNYLQEAASINAEHLGFSKSNFDDDKLNVTWVMTRMRVSVFRRANWNETVKVFTYPRPARRIVAWRDFIIYDEADNIIAKASTEWMMIDMTARRPVAIPEFVTERANKVRSGVYSDSLGFKLAADAFENAKCDYKIRAAKSDIDLNRHVNNVRYITWIFDALEEDFDKLEIELAFKSEVVQGVEVWVDIAQNGEEKLARVHSTCDHVIARIKPL